MDGCGPTSNSDSTGKVGPMTTDGSGDDEEGEEGEEGDANEDEDEGGGEEEEEAMSPTSSFPSELSRFVFVCVLLH